MVQDDEIERLSLVQPGYDTINSKNESMMPGYGNMGNTCFANSVLQCLVHTPALREYCLLGRHSEGCTIKAHAVDLSTL
jgi:ubiquitin C-terminal hydrolase